VADAASGKVLGSTVLSYGQGITARPALPARLKAGETLTVDGRSGADTRFRVRAESGPMLDSQIVVALPLRDVDETLQRLLLVIALVIGAILLALALAARTVIRIGLAPLDRIEQTAGAIAAGDLSHRVEIADPRTEVGRLGGAFNGMLDRLERAFAEREASEGRLRRFLADASHELRTPLASIRGYAELSRLGVVRADAETTRSMRRIEDEAARMGVLVEDLLTLARLDQVSEAARAPVDLARLAADAVEDARATARDREIALVAEPRATVLGDADQLRQVLGNLLRNALVHTPAGTPVEVTVSVDGLRVALEVRDHGAGLPTKRAEALFERFWRPGPGRGRQKDGGVGLGLAIVAGIVEAHHGTVEASDADGGGASFRAFFPSPRAGT